ncbi:hypothetical protein F9C07_2162 [Aspergillus flavus]|uniref:Uncharacterized protein n=1 Tax=Aspergillus flavus (strain ATCC 200026 / FGSC A1120 / IAM 13836 / NRRL 3357 / JCM 12722 / SRRC 167) TaxID=332952 RepID=A0A7U2MFN7_ASPFN|nr:hypothetical protein F9C07_2162 [Aspergillus flavus]
MVDNLHRRQKCCVPVNKCGALAAVLKALVPQHGTTTAHHQVQSPYATLKQKVKG